MKIDTFICHKCREENLIRISFIFPREQHDDLTKQIKKIPSYTLHHFKWMRGVVSEETVVLALVAVEMNVRFINRVDKVIWSQ